MVSLAFGAYRDLIVAHDLNNPTPDDVALFRDVLKRDGHPVESMSDAKLVEAMRARLREKIPAPAPRAGSRPVNGRVWLHEVLTSGGFRQPEDRHQLANLGDGGEPIPLGALAILTMRHMSDSTDADWSDERLAREANGDVEDLKRGQALLDEVAILVDRPATPFPRWWE